MSPAAVPGCSDVHRLDVEMFGTDGVTSPYVIDAREPILIDTGPASSAEEILEALDVIGVAPDELSYILPTHAHLDHAGGAGHLVQACPGATVLCHERAAPYLTDETRLERLKESVEAAIGMPEPYGSPTTIDPGRCHELEAGESLHLGDRELVVIDAPGHAPHQVCLYDRQDGLLFSADAAGMSLDDVQRPTTPPPDFDLDAAIETLDRLREYEPETVLYGHFGWGAVGEGVEELAAYAELLPSFVTAIENATRDVGEDPPAIARNLDDRWHHWALQTDIAGVLEYLSD